MPTTMVALPPSYIKNFQIYDQGSIFDSTKCLYRQGTWAGGKLNGDSVYTDFFNTIVNIKVGPYVSSLPDGTIAEYTFDKTLWNTFVSNSAEGISATKNINIYASGTLISTESTESVNITAMVGKNSAGNVIAFSFNEVSV